MPAPKSMKMIYVAGLITEPDRDSGWIAGFTQLGCDVIPFDTQPEIYPVGLLGRICRRFNIGRVNKQLQQSLLDLCDREQPVWIHFRMPIEFGRKTILEIKNRGILVTQYFNDDAFSKSHAIGLHWKFRHALSSYDGHFVWRSRDIEIYRKAGASHTEHSPPYYDPERVFLTDKLTTSRDFLADAAFLGHWEDDWRADCLDALVSSGLSIILKGGNEGWGPAIKGRRIGHLAPITWACDDEYRHIYSNVVAGLCFFSKINNDMWTKRAMEIVAVGGLLVCERTEEAKQNFNDRQEAYFFSSIEELITIVKKLKNDPIKRERVRAAGHARLMQSDNTILCRTKQVYQFAAAKVAVST